MTGIKELIACAEKICINAGAKLTPKRKSLIELFYKENKALSAYELSSKLKESQGISTPVMSIYRILKFLEKLNLVHRISSINKYTLCKHITCKHEHNLPRFAICLNCLKVQEIASNILIKEEIKQSLSTINFHLESEQIELQGLCSNCK